MGMKAARLVRSQPAQDVDPLDRKRHLIVNLGRNQLPAFVPDRFQLDPVHQDHQGCSASEMRYWPYELLRRRWPVLRRASAWSQPFWNAISSRQAILKP